MSGGVGPRLPSFPWSGGAGCILAPHAAEHLEVPRALLLRLVHRGVAHHVGHELERVERAEVASAVVRRNLERRRGPEANRVVRRGVRRVGGGVGGLVLGCGGHARRVLLPGAGRQRRRLHL